MISLITTAFNVLIYFLKCFLFFLTEIPSNASVTSSLFTSVRLPQRNFPLFILQTKFLQQLGIHTLNNFLSAITNEPTHVVFVIAEPPFLQQMKNNLRRGAPRGQPLAPFLSP